MTVGRAIQQSWYPLYVINVSCDDVAYDITMCPDKASVEFQRWEKIINSLRKLVRKFIFTNNLHKGQHYLAVGSIRVLENEFFEKISVASTRPRWGSVADFRMVFNRIRVVLSQL